VQISSAENPTAGRSRRAQLAEYVGDVAAAATLYADSIERWRGFGDVQELAFALLGHGRCLLALGEPAEAEERLLEARDSSRRSSTSPRLRKRNGCLAVEQQRPSKADGPAQVSDPFSAVRRFLV